MYWVVQELMQVLLFFFFKLFYDNEEVNERCNIKNLFFELSFYQITIRKQLRFWLTCFEIADIK